MNPRLLRPLARFQAPPSGTPASLLLRFDGDFSDSSPNALTVTPNGDASISTTTKKFGSGSAFFDGDGDFAAAPSAADLGDGDFTVEMWCYPLAFGEYTVIAGNLNENQLGSKEWQIICNGTPGEISWYFPQEFLTISGTLVTDEWQHLAFVRHNGTMSLYINGVLAGAVSHAYDYSEPSNELWVGNAVENTPSRFYNGYIDDFRIVKGLAVYQGEYAPPAETLSVNATVAPPL
jgi:hypothetical protein